MEKNCISKKKEKFFTITLTFTAGLMFTLMLTTTLILTLIYSSEAQGQSRRAAQTDRSDIRAVSAPSANMRPRLLSPQQFSRLSEVEQRRYVRNLQVVMVHFEKLQFQFGMKASNQRRSAYLQLLMPYAYANGSNTCVVAGRLRSRNADGTCPVWGYNCNPDGGSPSSQHIQCGAIFGGKCVKRMDDNGGFSGLSERCLQAAEEMNVEEIRAAYDAMNTRFNGIYDRMREVCGVEENSETAGCTTLLAQLRRLNEVPIPEIEPEVEIIDAEEEEVTQEARLVYKCEGSGPSNLPPFENPPLCDEAVEVKLPDLRDGAVGALSGSGCIENWGLRCEYKEMLCTEREKERCSDPDDDNYLGESICRRPKVTIEELGCNQIEANLEEFGCQFNVEKTCRNRYHPLSENENYCRGLSGMGAQACRGNRSEPTVFCEFKLRGDRCRLPEMGTTKCPGGYKYARGICLIDGYFNSSEVRSILREDTIPRMRPGDPGRRVH